MFSHFQYKEIATNHRLRKAYEFSFFYRGQHYRGFYHPNGKIDWYEPQPPADLVGKFESQVHELMLFHVYEK